MKRGSTLFLRGSILLIGLVIFALCVFIVTADGGGFDLLIIGIYATTIPFYYALYQGWKLLGYIDRQKAFSAMSVKALTAIKYCASIICGMYIAGLPFLYVLVQQEDSPGLLAFGFIIVFTTFVVATLAGLLQKLFQQAIAIKTENELTV